jgi:flavodoxin
MNILIVFYSRTGTTKKIAEAISNTLQCNLEEIFDTKNREGTLGYLISGRDSMLKNLTMLKEIKNDPSLYDLIIIGTPIWFYNVSTPIRTYLIENKEKFKKVAFFCTEGSSGGDRAMKEMAKLCGQEPIGTLELKTKEIIQEKYSLKVKEFINKIKN